MTRRRQGALVVAILLLPLAAWAQPVPPGEPPARIGPEWDHRKHQPTPAEVEARQRAQGVPAGREEAGAREVDRLYRDLTGGDPTASPRSTDSRATDRR